jgi:hypothetical protein
MDENLLVHPCTDAIWLCIKVSQEMAAAPLLIMTQICGEMDSRDGQRERRIESFLGLVKLGEQR